MRITKIPHEKIIKYWEDAFTDESAASYMESYGEGPGSPLRNFISSLINDYETVLDVGCGPGWNWDHFQEHGPRIQEYLGLDYSKRFVKVANQRVGLHLFVVGDVRNIEQPDGSWDVVLLQDVLEHTNGYEKPLNEALRVARKRIIITFWHLDDNDDPHINDDGADTYGSWYDKREWEKYLDSLNLFWIHDTLPRKDAKWDIYIIDKKEKHGK